MVELILAREDANTEAALLVEWLAADQGEITRGQAVCVVETAKASIELEAPAAGLLVQLYPAGATVEPGTVIAVVATGADELAAALERRAAPAVAAPTGPGNATRKAAALAALHGVDLAAIEKRGFITEADVEEHLRRAGAAVGGTGTASLLRDVSTAGVTIPPLLLDDGDDGRLDPAFLAELRSRPDRVRNLPSAEKCEAYRGAGAIVGRDVVLEDRVLIAAERVVIDDGVRLGAGASVDCAELFAVGALTHVGPGLEVRCRRAVLGTNVHAGRSIRIGGGGNRDPWALFAAGDLTFIGDEVFVNPARPVLLGREVFLTQRAMIVTHNIGHSVLEGFENRFAPVVIEDRAQIGLGTVVYAGCRVGREAIVASSSYVVSDVPPGKLAIGVPARVAGEARRPLSRPRQVELAQRLLADLEELLRLRGHATVPADRGPRGFTLAGHGSVLFEERFDPGRRQPTAEETVVLTLEYGGGTPPAGWSVLDLLERRLHGEGGPLLDATREFCRKRGIRVEPGPWRYGGGLI